MGVSEVMREGQRVGEGKGGRGRGAGDEGSGKWKVQDATAQTAWSVWHASLRYLLAA